MGLLLLSVVFVFLQTRGIIDPIRRAMLELPRPIAFVVRGVVKPVKDFFHTLYVLKNTVKDNATLASRVKSLEETQVELDGTRRENEQLKKELSFTSRSKLKLMPCTVLSFDPEGITDSFTISCGKDQGVKEGMPVVTDGHLAGKVVFASGSTSTAEFLTRPGSNVDAKISRSNSLGVVKGSYASGITFEAVSQSSDIQKNDIIITAGVNSLIPAGLIIGTVEEVISKDNELFKRTTIVSPLKFHDLAYVFIAQ